MKAEDMENRPSEAFIQDPSKSCVYLYLVLSDTNYTPESLSQLRNVEQPTPEGPSSTLSMGTETSDEHVLSAYTKLQAIPEDQFPNVRWFFSQSWKEHEKATRDLKQPGPRGSSRADDGVNIAFPFIEDTEGRSVDGFAARQMRDSTRRILNELYPASGPPPPSSFSKLPHRVHMRFTVMLTSVHPELKLCSASWKSSALGKSVFRSWKTTWTNERKRANGEPLGSSKKAKTARPTIVSHEIMNLRVCNMPNR
jgi:hypothetical protein